MPDRVSFLQNHCCSCVWLWCGGFVHVVGQRTSHRAYDAIQNELSYNLFYLPTSLSPLLSIIPKWHSAYIVCIVNQCEWHRAIVTIKMNLLPSSQTTSVLDPKCCRSPFFTWSSLHSSACVYYTIRCINLLHPIEKEKFNLSHMNFEWPLKGKSVSKSDNSKQEDLMYVWWPTWPTISSIE